MAWSEVSLTRGCNLTPGQGSSGYDEGVMRPDLLIRGRRTEPCHQPKAERSRSGSARWVKGINSLMQDLVTDTLESSRSLLLPCDPSPRLLELLVLLDQHWSFRLTPNRQNRLPPEEIWPYPLCLVSRSAQDMLAFARSLIEWMGGVIRDSGGSEAVDEMDGSKKGRKGRRRQAGKALGSEYGALDFRYEHIYRVPADCRHVQCFSSPGELLQAFRSCDRNSFLPYLPPCHTDLRGSSLLQWQ